MSKVYHKGHPLRSAWLKTQRADVHISGLKRSINRLLNPQVVIGEKGEPQGAPELVSISIDPRMQDTWGLIIGDVVSNLRASLDHIAWALAQKRVILETIILTESQERAIQFPLCDTPADFSSGTAQRQIRHCLPAAHATIESFQPYNRRQWSEVYLLGVLCHLSNEDKHRIVTPTIMRAHVRLMDGDPGVILSLNQQRQFQLVRDVSQDLKPQIAFEVVVYTKGYPSRRSIVSPQTLSEINNFIRHKVIPAFDSFF